MNPDTIIPRARTQNMKSAKDIDTKKWNPPPAPKKIRAPMRQAGTIRPIPFKQDLYDPQLTRDDNEGDVV
jgi:hypothetical protein